MISLLQLFWKKHVTTQFTPTADQFDWWLNVYEPGLIRDAIQVLAKYLTTHEMTGKECILYLCKTMSNMRKQRGPANLSQIVIGHSAPDPEHNDPMGGSEYDNNSAEGDNDRFMWSSYNKDDDDMGLN
jgi:hypothetical protein